MTPPAPGQVYVDARPFQAAAWRGTEAGRHAASLLAALRSETWAEGAPTFVGVTDVAQAPMPGDARLLFDRVTTRRAPDPIGEASRRDWFLSPAPLTTDPVWARRFLGDPSLLRIALFHDLSALDAISGPDDGPLRTDRLIAVAWLRSYNLIAAVSEAAAGLLSDRLAIEAERIVVTGPAPAGGRAKPVWRAREMRGGVLAPTDATSVEDLAVVVEAHGASAAFREARIGLTLAGELAPPARRRLEKTYALAGGETGLLRFVDADENFDLREGVQSALVVVAAAGNATTSLTLVESARGGTPTLACDIRAYAALLQDPRWRFEPGDVETLRNRLESLALDDAAWGRARHAQAAGLQEVTAEAAATRLQAGVGERAPPARPALLRCARPSLAVLTPLGPSASGVTALGALKPLVDLHVFTSTSDAAWEEGWASLQPLSEAAFSPGRFDATLGLIGPSAEHVDTYEQVLEHGGAVASQGAHLLPLLLAQGGPVLAAEAASRELGRPVSVDEIAAWSENPATLPTIFYAKLVRAAEPLFVASDITADRIARDHHLRPTVLRSPPRWKLGPSDLSEAARTRARRALRIDAHELLITSFDVMGASRAAREMVWALKFLREWGVSARLVLQGRPDAGAAASLAALAAELDIASFVETPALHAGDRRQRIYLAAADVALQFSTAGPGSVCEGLTDVIAAALPAVTNVSLAEAMEAPSFVRRTPDSLSAVLIAEAVLEIARRRDGSARPEAEAEAYTARHSRHAYVRALLGGLGIDAAAVRAAG